MNCPDHTRCAEVVRQLWEFIDQELTPARAEEVRSHLEACAACFPHYDVQRAFLAFLRRQCESPVPPALRRRVFEQLLEEARAES